MSGSATLSWLASMVAAGTLSWNAVSGADNYIIWWGTSSGVYTNDLGVGNVTSYPLSSLGLAPGGTYYMVVIAYNASGQESPASAEIVVNT